MSCEGYLAPVLMVILRHAYWAPVCMVPMKVVCFPRLLVRLVLVGLCCMCASFGGGRAGGGVQ